MYRKCPHQWATQYKEGHKRYSPSIHLVFGTAMHEAIQHYLDVMYDKSASAADRCHFGTGHGASIGSLGEVYLKNITMRNIVFDGTDCGPKIKVCGCVVEINHNPYPDPGAWRCKGWAAVWRHLWEFEPTQREKCSLCDYGLRRRGRPSLHNPQRDVPQHLKLQLHVQWGALQRWRDFTFDEVNLNSKSWTCQNKGDDNSSPKSGCDCFTKVQGQAQHISPDVSKCFQGGPPSLPSPPSRPPPAGCDVDGTSWRG